MELTYNQLLALCAVYVTGVVRPEELLSLTQKDRDSLTNLIYKTEFPKITHGELLKVLAMNSEAKAASDVVIAKCSRIGSSHQGKGNLT